MKKQNKIPLYHKKIGMFTDIHFGRRSNSRVHNQDCLDYISWFCEKIKKTNDYSHIFFLGDWFESRSAINIETLEYSYKGLQLINNLGLPTKVIVGNHDLHKRTTRDIHSIRMFNEFTNIQVIDEIFVEDNLLISPFLFHEEYGKLIQYNDLYAWFGHFEFKNFEVTGYGTILDHGPDHKLFKGPKRIFTGHFHKRQNIDNIHFIGNCYPMDFGDAGDNKRGMATYEIESDKLTFTDWEECPKYLKVKLSDIIANKWNPLPKMSVRCIVDTELSFQEGQDLKEALIKDCNLRDFFLEEDKLNKQGLLEGDSVKINDGDLDFTGVDDLVIKQLESINDPNLKQIQPKKLVEIYKNIKVETSKQVD